MKWTESTEEKRFTERTDFTDDAGEEIVIGEPIGRPIYGFGCCFNELNAIALSRLSKEKRDEVLDELFGQENSAFCYCRLSIGGNDFSENWYSYDETDGDYELKDFSIDRDRKYIIPLVKEAQKRSPDLEFFASPWSPPTWMKYPKVCNGGHLLQDEKTGKAYAQYFVRFLEAYRQEGIRIRQIAFQNEFHRQQRWPSCVFTPEECERFLADYLIDAVGDRAEVWFGTVNGPDDGCTVHNPYLNFVMQNEKCRKHITGAAYQWSGKFSILPAQEDFPELNLIHSECECGDGKNSWDYAMYTFMLLRHYFRYGARANVYWNMALDGSGLSSWEWSQNSLVTVNNGEYTYNPDYYALKHFAHFVRRGAVLCKTEGHYNTNTAAFRNEDGSYAVVVMNPFEQEKKITIRGKTAVLKPRSFNTFTDI